MPLLCVNARLCWDVPDWKGEAVFQGDVLIVLLASWGHGAVSVGTCQVNVVCLDRTIAY